MKPTIGRIVLYLVGPSDCEDLRHNGSRYLPAIVVAAHSPICVNLKSFTDGPRDVWKTSVKQGDAEYCWSWPKRDG